LRIDHTPARAIFRTRRWLSIFQTTDELYAPVLLLSPCNFPEPVDADIIRFLGRSEQAGITLIGYPRYVREWIRCERAEV